ncbi:MAG: flagellar export chaperone FliS [Phycisphaerales bacterium]
MNTPNNQQPTNSFPGQSPQANAYLRTRVMTASPEELRLMLLDGAIKFANQGAEGLKKRDFEASFNGISQCRNIIFELMTTIRADADPDLATKVRSLYSFMYTQIIEASHERDAEKLSRVIELLEYERETWVMLMQKLAEERSAAATGSPTRPAASAPVTTGARPPLSVSA